jgi:hypothetical protein
VTNIVFFAVLKLFSTSLRSLLVGARALHSKVIIMNFLEKIISLLAIIFAAGLVVSLIYFPQLRQIHFLIPISLVGLVVNVALIFIVLRDIFSRRFNDQNRKYMWIALVLIFWPSIICYLYSYGFRPRDGQQLL